MHLKKQHKESETRTCGPRSSQLRARMVAILPKETVLSVNRVQKTAGEKRRDLQKHTYAWFSFDLNFRDGGEDFTASQKETRFLSLSFFLFSLQCNDRQMLHLSVYA